MMSQIVFKKSLRIFYLDFSSDIDRLSLEDVVPNIIWTYMVIYKRFCLYFFYF